MDETPVYFMNLPTTVRGFVTFGADSEPIIVLNARMSTEQQRETWLHEVNHIASGHLFDDAYTDAVEYGGLYG